MLESLTESLRNIFRGVQSRGKVTDADLKATMREIRRVLLEADVHFQVAKDFCKRVEERALGQEVLKSLRPEQVIIKTVHDTLVEFMGPVEPGIPFNAQRGTTVIMMCGLQGSGKTTTCAKLALFLKKKGNNPLLVAADLQRPAAVDQLAVLGRQLGVPVYVDPDTRRPPEVCERAVKHALAQQCNVTVLDTAGRLAIDEPLMRELAEVRRAAAPDQVYLVCDGMLGQDAVASAEGFNRRLPLDGIILTKLDGDTRGGAAISVKAVVGKPIKFIGVGEKPEALQEFRPQGMAERILGFGDVVGLVEKVQEHVNQEQAEAAARKMFEGTFSLDDFLGQLEMMEKMGSVKDLLKMIPGMGALGDLEVEDHDLGRLKGIIRSMTFQERTRPDLVDASRRRRIAKGSGTTVVDVNALLKQFREMSKMMQKLSGSGMLGRMYDHRLVKQRRKRQKVRGMNLGKVLGHP
ncbi:MAG: signal recognition particle protein [Planctomycetes bacterium]|nr:signal recognition particle protein [Planctomycetota bacterium]